MTHDEDFEQIFQLIGGYFHQDMDLEADTIPEAISNYAREAGESEKNALLREMDLFLERFHNNAEAEFRARYGSDFTPDELGQTVAEFFAMVREILADPSSYVRFEHLHDRPRS